MQLKYPYIGIDRRSGIVALFFCQNVGAVLYGAGVTLMGGLDESTFEQFIGEVIIKTGITATVTVSIKDQSEVGICSQCKKEKLLLDPKGSLDICRECSDKLSALGGGELWDVLGEPFFTKREEG